MPETFLLIVNLTDLLSKMCIFAYLCHFFSFIALWSETVYKDYLFKTYFTLFYFLYLLFTVFSSYILYL